MDDNNIMDDDNIMDDNIDNTFIYKDHIIYNLNIDTTHIKNVLLIDNSVVNHKVFYDYVNSDTFPIVYSYYADKEELINMLSDKFTNIERLGLVMHNGTFPFKKFLNNQDFFTISDLSIEFESELDFEKYSENFLFIINLVKKFNIKNLDNLACKSLLDELWKKYYNILNNLTGVIVGASDDYTGNIKYGADWIMESTGEDVQSIYWDDNIFNYSNQLDSTSLNQSGGTIYFRQLTSTSQIDYSTDNINWNSVGSNWPIQITNTNPTSLNILTVIFTTNMTLNNTTTGNLSNCYFKIKSEYITINGQNNVLTINETPTLNNGNYYFNYNGLILNGGQEGYSNITIQNFGVLVDASVSNGTLQPNAGWICQQNFATIIIYAGFIELTNCYVNSCYSNGIIYPDNGGIIGRLSCATAYNCYSTGSINFGAGGIFGPYSLRSAKASNCYSTGLIYTINGVGGSGGIFGGGCSGVAEYCYSTGNIALCSGGIFGSGCGLDNYDYKGFAIAINCYSTGTIAQFAGGIFGQTSAIYAINCYSRGTIGGYWPGGIYGGGGGIVGASSVGTAINCYSSGDVSWGAGGIFGMTPGKLKIINCYSSGKILYSIPNYDKYQAGLIGYNGFNTNFFNNVYTSDMVINSYSENKLMYDANNLTNLNNNTWTDSNASNYLTSFFGNTWISNSLNTPYILKTVTNITKLNGFEISSPQNFNPTPFIPTLPTPSTVNGTITYLSNDSTIASVNSTSGAITMANKGTVVIIACLNETLNYQLCAVIKILKINAGIRNLIGYSISNQILNTQTTFTPPAPTFSIGTGTISYSSSNQSIATINSSTGAINMIATGTVTITASSPATTQYNSCSTTATFIICNTAKLYKGNQTASPGIYYITGSNNSLINGKTISIDNNGLITILSNANLYTSNTSKVYSNNSQINLGSNASSIILTKQGIKYSIDGQTWN
jgi:hypothetical protein